MLSPRAADEEDKFEDDFASTDEEADKVAPELVEATAQDEERQARKVRLRSLCRHILFVLICVLYTIRMNRQSERRSRRTLRLHTRGTK